jgi:hypothetical protein
MSPQIKPLIVGLASPGLFWLATSVAFGQDAPAPQGPPTAAPTSPATYQVLLLNSGKVVRGVIVPFASAYCLKGSGGPVPYPKTMVMKAAQSVEELYQFQLRRLPAGDADERIKLARWCLIEKLDDHAREQLEAVEQMSPGDKVVEKMLYSLAANERSLPPVDPSVRRSSVDAGRGDVPDPLDPEVVKKGRRFNGLPTIFDLPPAQAVKRFNEFAEFVQPVLQQNCVKCHNEKYQGDFQLVEAKIRRDRTNVDILRANLDATLRLINADDPSRSELLSAGLVPHGGNRNAIFKGPNDHGYMILVTWIKRVRPVESAGQKAQTDLGARPGFNTSEPMPGDGFATDRSKSSSGFPMASGAGSYPPLPGESSGGETSGTQIPQNRSRVTNYNESAEFVRSPGDNPQFPSPFVIGGAQALPPPQNRNKPKAGTNGSTGQSPPKQSAQTAKPIGHNAVQVGPTETPNELPGMDRPLYPTSPSKGDDAKPEDAPPPPDASKKKPKKIDDALLERLMRTRNGGIPASPSP